MSLKAMLAGYDATQPLNRASTPPSSWYTDETFYRHELNAVFKRNWLMAGRVEQLSQAGDFFTLTVAGQPLIVLMDDEIKAFYNVCRHHAAAVEPANSGCRKFLTCPYHGWSYRLDGSLIAAPLFEGVEDFDKKQMGLRPVRCEIWHQWIFVCLDPAAPDLKSFLGDLYNQVQDRVPFYKRVEYEVDCNWKVYVDNYLDGGYHVPFLHKGLSSALDNRQYRIENGQRYCLQSCPTKAADNDVAAVRRGTARYFWQYPNFMINLYDGIMGTMLVEPLAVDRCKVIFDYHFDDNHAAIDEEFKQHSVEVADQVQQEDADICLSVQRGLNSDAYVSGRLSVKKESGEHLFHRLLQQDLASGIVD